MSIKLPMTVKQTKAAAANAAFECSSTAACELQEASWHISTVCIVITTLGPVCPIVSLARYSQLSLEGRCRQPDSAYDASIHSRRLYRW